jgi:hypothetical protein
VLLAVDDHEESCLTKLKCFSDFDVEWMEECILFGVVLFENQIAANSFLLELHDLTEVIAFAHFLLGRDGHGGEFPFDGRQSLLLVGRCLLLGRSSNFGHVEKL